MCRAYLSCHFLFLTGLHLISRTIRLSTVTLAMNMTLATYHAWHSFPRWVAIANKACRRTILDFSDQQHAGETRDPQTFQLGRVSHPTHSALPAS